MLYIFYNHIVYSNCKVDQKKLPHILILLIVKIYFTFELTRLCKLNTTYEYTPFFKTRIMIIFFVFESYVLFNRIY